MWWCCEFFKWRSILFVRNAGGFYNLRQRGRNIVTYLDKSGNLYRLCPPSLRPFLGNHFVARLDNKAKIDMVQLYLNGKMSVTFPEAT